jgi:hypothetical protein
LLIIFCTVKDFDGGRGGGGGGRGGAGGGGGRSSGKNKHMGEIGAILALMRSNGMTDRDILNVINPPRQDRERTVTDIIIPGHKPWRFATPIGARLEPNRHVVRSNFFRVDTSRIPSVIYQYGVHVFPFDKEVSDFSTEDVAGKEDSRVLFSLIIELQRRHPEWNTNPAFALTYDGRSLIFTTLTLPFTEVNSSREPYFTEVLTIKNIDGSESRKRYKVAITLTSVIRLSEASDEVATEALDSPILSFARWGVVSDNPEWFTVGSKVSTTYDSLDPF